MVVLGGLILSKKQYPQIDLQIQYNFYANLSCFFFLLAEIDKLSLYSYGKSRTQIVKTISKKKNKLRGLSLFNFKGYCKPIVYGGSGIRIDLKIKE